MAEPVEVPEEFQPGKWVYIERVGGIPRKAYSGPFRVDRLTKTRIVLSNGDWYPRERHRPSRSEGTWSATRYLLPNDADTRAKVNAYSRVIQARAAYVSLNRPEFDWSEEDWAQAIVAAKEFIEACEG